MAATTISPLLMGRWMQRQLSKDTLIHVTATPAARLALVTCTHTINEGLRRFEVTDPQVAVLYARTLACSTLMSAFFKDEERIIIRFVYVIILLQQLKVSWHPCYLAYSLHAKSSCFPFVALFTRVHVYVPLQCQTIRLTLSHF